MSLRFLVLILCTVPSLPGTNKPHEYDTFRTVLEEFFPLRSIKGMFGVSLPRVYTLVSVWGKMSTLSYFSILDTYTNG